MKLGTSWIVLFTATDCFTFQGLHTVRLDMGYSSLLFGFVEVGGEGDNRIQ
jgi:hypothetical protein